MPALAPFAALVAEGFRGGRDGQWQKQAELAVANLTRVLLMRDGIWGMLLRATGAGDAPPEPKVDFPETAKSAVDAKPGTGP